MSGPTGTRGAQGIKGGVGVTGPIGISGQDGGAGPVGSQGVNGPTGITGGTGTQLYGNASLVQSGQCTNLGSDSPIIFASQNPALVNGKSTTISGQYDSTQLNYYGVPLSINGALITIPVGNYYISATMPISINVVDTDIVYLTLSTYDGSTYTPIAWSTPANKAGVCHLQYVYRPTVDTVVSFLSSVTNTPAFSVGTPHVNLSIVKIW
jgi:collagen type II alpha